jgi:hypothetical protein
MTSCEIVAEPFFGGPRCRPPGIAPGDSQLEKNMEKKIAGLLGAVATLGAFNAAQAAPTPSPAPTDVLRANSFAELLEPIPNAASLLQAVDESAPSPSADEKVQLAQLYVYHHHHHHHHHGFYRRYAPRVVVVPPPRYRYYHHHHHHHHHHSFYRRDY